MTNKICNKIITFESDRSIIYINMYIRLNKSVDHKYIHYGGSNIHLKQI